MSEKRVAAEACTALDAGRPALAAYPNRDASLGDLRIARALPIRDRRMVGPWCFLDRFGPLAFGSGRPMNVPPHPHIGLQTVSWLVEGEVLHSDSLGNESIVRPGGVNVMTAGRGIAHAEETPIENSGRLSGVQLWVALPDARRDVEPSFDHVERVPRVEVPGGVVQVVADSPVDSAEPASGSPARVGEVTPSARHYSALVALDVEIFAGETLELGLSAGFEHAALLLLGDCAVERQTVRDRTLYYLGTGRSRLSVGSADGGRLLIVGGPPFPEPILMWWNFVARTPEEISRARDDWEEHRRFGEVAGEHAPRLAAPPLGRFARPNPLS